MTFATPITKDELLDLLDERWFILIDGLRDRNYWDMIVGGINKSIENGFSIIPEKVNIFRALNTLRLDKFRVLLIGQDPYPTIGNANGYSFSANPLRGRIPPSLDNIFNEIDRSYGSTTMRNNGNLSKWVDQGVLLLNSYLTIGTKTGIKKINDSHRSIGWGEFTSEIIRYLDSKYKFVTLALGKEAQKISSIISENRSLIIEAPHPSPMNTARPFIGCDCFVKCNDLLIRNELSPIKWTI